MSVYVDGRDVSAYQDDNKTPQKIDFGKMYAAGIRWVGIRAASGSSIDEDFRYNWKAAKDAGLKRMAYFWWNYLPNSVKGPKQVEFWMSLLADDRGELPPAIDFEWPRSDYPPLPSREICIDTVWNYFNSLNIKLSVPKGTFYSNPNSMVQRLLSLEGGNYVVPSWLREHHLWIAHWGVPMPTLLYGWKTWTFWQYGLGQGNGIKEGVESLGIDMDYFNGGMEELDALCGKVPPPVVTPALTTEQRLERIEKALVNMGITL